MKYYNEFTEEERKDIDKLISIYFTAEMSDNYACTLSEQSAGLKWFNDKNNYNFGKFAPNFYGEKSKTFFY